MKKNVKRALIAFGLLVVIGLGAFYVTKVRTKSYSPEETVTFSKADLKLEVFYNRPYKKGREIFGELVPYNEVWRTGANEATTFETNQDILIDGSLLPKGKYTLWTIPMENSWKVIFNSKMYPWGITLEKAASREPDYDVLTVEFPVNKIYNSVEQFSIYFEEVNNLVLMIIAWDKTTISVPIKEQE